MMGTNCEQGRNKISPLLPTPKREKNWMPHQYMLSLFIGCMKLLFFQIICHHFGMANSKGTKSMSL
jgi:hypothetical protein